MLINLTPHAINIMAEDGSVTTLPPSGTVARVATVRTAAPTINGWRVIRQTFGQVEGLPEPQPGTTYVVSAIVLAALGGQRPDVVAPDTGPDAVRKDGQIVAVRGFVI